MRLPFTSNSFDAGAEQRLGSRYSGVHHHDDDQESEKHEQKRYKEDKMPRVGEREGPSALEDLREGGKHTSD
jgi:hypothetical protein